MTAPIAIGGELTVYVAHEVRLQLLQAFEANASPTLDLGEVAEFDGAGLQLLVAAAREAEHRGGRLHIADASPVVTETLTLAGHAALLAPADAPEGAA